MKRKVYICGNCGKKFEVFGMAMDYIYKFKNQKFCRYNCYIEYRKQNEKIKRLGLKNQ